MRVYEVAEGSTSLDGLVAAERDKPTPGANQVLVKMRAASLNYRDIAIVIGKYFGGPVKRNTIPLSDGAGEVEAVGDGVTAFKPGDRVVATFFQPPSGAPLGSPLDGMLTEYAVLDAGGLLPIPANLTFEQAATLPCAGVTAWRALMDGRQLKPGETVLTLGTGGVSIQSLLIAKAAGARVIVTSSSNEKLARARELGADETINYREHPEWASSVLELTGGRGADIIVELGGVGTLPQSYQAVGPGGEIALIGVLAPPDGDLSPHPMMLKGATLRGIFVGPKSDFEALNRAIEVNSIEPVVDTVYDFDDAPGAYECMLQGKHFGKLVVRVAG